MASQIDFGPFMEPVARQLFGEPNKHMSSKSDLRFGSHGSLSIDVKAGTFFDHETKEGGGVLDLIARKTGRANGEAVDWLREQGFDVGSKGEAAPQARGRIVATYDYVDELGELMFQVCRFEPKTFRQRRRARFDDSPDKVHDGWVWSVKGVRQVPYRLPDLLEALAMERTVFVVEGEKDAGNLSAAGATATCNAMGAGKWPESLREFFAGADVVHLPDNDEAGRNHTAIVGASLKDVAARQRVLELPDLPPKGDVSDWLAAGGTVDALHQLVETRARPWSVAPTALHFGAVWFADVERALEEPEWLVDDLLTRSDKSLVYGPSQSGKSFLATHIAMSISRGVDFFDRKTRRGGVVYIAAEGRKGFKKRLKAYRQEFGIEPGTPLPFLLVPAAVDLYAQDGDTTALVADLKLVVETMAGMGVALELVVVDTLAAVSPGANENASEDMSRIIRHCEAIQEVTRAHVMIVHHKNAAGDRPRGHTSLYAACDNAIEVSCDEAKNRSAKIAKMKDGEDGASIGFRLQSVTIGSRDDGKPITSCVVVPAQEGMVRTGKGQKMPDQQKIALQALREALVDHGETAPAVLDLPHGVRVVHAKHWKREFLNRAFDEPPTDAAFRQAVKRVGDALVSKRIIGRNQPYLWIVREPSA